MSNPVGAPLRRRKKLGKRAETLPLNESFIILPEDVVIDILSRLSAKDVLRCRCVCKGWRDLSSTSDFTDIYFQRSVPMILKDTHPKALNLKEQTMLDGCWEPTRMRSAVLKINKPRGDIYFSHNGLIVACGGERGADFVIYNPLYIDVVNISIEPCRGKVCGVFFHPMKQEICTLWEMYPRLEPLKLRYKILNLESNPMWRDIENPCTTNPMIWHICPVLIDQHLYWMAKPPQDYNSYPIVNCDMVEYDIRNEEFRVIPCPAPVSVNRQTDYYVNLVDTDGVVSVVMVIQSKGLSEINMWTFKDDGEQLWTSFNYIISCDVFRPDTFIGPKALAFRNGELVLHFEGRLCVFNLKLGTFRKFGRKYSSMAKFYSYVPSLVSLKNWKSDLIFLLRKRMRIPSS